MTSSEQDKIDAKVGNDSNHDAFDANDSANLTTRLEQGKAQEAAADADTPEVAALKKDPTAPARMHGNEPSRGAKIDAQIQAEEEAELERKGKA
ncbi:hypothetical protein A1Q2_00414 [Trichosporon asahii var. asahii CBS 8904]|uniref:Uncharacterized protein n=2 Tax=Trichosporon asahii var. asahii TaxID=189963 RepID=K1WWV7_TRIAC|nr:hypothetical protein A1Q1_04763 [Trichosporon asahii var. asahii CBS 2479]EJT46586.1 hypothetical protein A1Q1_04763 [Trichosporon asahii var. asahii CBS 2479]EKD05184.1 hypothetical protein A1Q2_00414 [Trichosporon asahii var. asahii CBS 8904]